MATGCLIGHARQLWQVYRPALSHFNGYSIINRLYYDINVVSGVRRFSKETANNDVDFVALAKELLRDDVPERIAKEALEECKRKMRVRQANLLKPRMIYEGPVNINYWIRKKGGGARR
ncbi:hypothetical protein BEWA_022950 [Theileria equi strain WA]|uniref:Uncharacterized protein n=1 Tax=Theileria equi strain WA TaxID=1537102 RepID=L0AV18_THEEQ|nr:hypothetical protein BEWA_022950 [Theileria equi strain WA]AFZ79447.1 hypothetical protein BEWA_022950 [Theileria equi strain WA]|eukprot:XP_004829113.1 hypothetical protein BEWA_022950 [Theileria equi strain WA]